MSLQGTGDVLSQRKYDVSENIFLLEPFNHPLITLLTNVGRVADGVTYKGSPMMKKTTMDPEFWHYEDTYGQRATTLQTTISDTVTTAVVVAAGTGIYFTPGDVIKAVTSTGTEEQMRVTAVNTGTDTLTVTRGYDAGANKLSSIPSGSNIYIVGNSSSEGDDARESTATIKAKPTNYTQIFKTPFEVTETLKNTTLWTENEFLYQNRKKAVEHALDIERALWFGKKLETTGSNGKPQRATGGVIEGIEDKGSAYIQDEAGSALTKAEFDAFLEKAFQYGNTTKWMFCSGTILTYISGFADNALQVVPSDKVYGIFVQQYISPHGTVNLVRNPLFTGSYSGVGIVLDMESLMFRALQNRDTHVVENVQGNGEDLRKDQFLTEAGLQRINFEKNAMLKGVV